jgi:threonine synthase
MRHILGFRCVDCGKEHLLAAVKYVCPACGGNLSVVYDYKAIRRRLTRARLAADRDPTLWRWLELLPVSHRRWAAGPPPGGTPLFPAPLAAAELGLTQVWVKDEGRNPSASLKDRASAVVLARARETGERVLAAASTGNAAASLACAMATLKPKPVIFVPESAPPAKLAQLLVYGAQVVAVRGTYDEAFDLCVSACREYGWYNRNTGYNPFTREGKKTCAFEVAEQLGWRVPDLVFVSVGDGNIVSGLWKGFTELKAVGLTHRLPRLVGVQARGSDGVARALERGGVLRPVSGRTVADSISVSLPRDGRAAVRALTESGGFALRVSDREILAAIGALAHASGVFAEPAAAAAYAGLLKAAALGRLRRGETAVVVSTGSGLKDVSSAARSVGKPFLIRPGLEAFKRLVAREHLAGASRRPRTP